MSPLLTFFVGIVLGTALSYPFYRGIIFFKEMWKLMMTPDDKEIECTDYPEHGSPFDDESTKM